MKPFVTGIATAIVLVCVFAVGTASGFRPDRNDRLSRETLSGIVGELIIEPAKTEPLKVLHYVEQDFLGYKLFVFVDGLDLADYVHDYVELAGIRSNFIPVTDKRQGSKTRNRTFQFGEKFEATQLLAHQSRKLENQPELAFGTFTVPPPSAGIRKTIGYLIDFVSQPTMGYTVEQFKHWVYNNTLSVKKYYEADSHYIPGVRGLTFGGAPHKDPNGDMVRVTINVDISNCGSNPFNSWRIAVQDAAALQGYVASEYATAMFFYTATPACSFGPSASVGQMGGTNATYQFYQVGHGTDISAFFPEKVYTIRHETDHNLGHSGHARGSDMPGGFVFEYGDEGDPIGGGKQFSSNVNKLRWGFFTSTTQFAKVDTAGSHSFRLQTPAVPSKGIGMNSPPAGLIIPIRDSVGQLTGRVYVFETRRQLGIFEKWSGANQTYAHGISMREVGTDLSDRRNNTMYYNAYPRPNWCCEALQAPDSYTTPEGIVITAGYAIGNTRYLKVVLPHDRYPM